MALTVASFYATNRNSNVFWAPDQTLNTFAPISEMPSILKRLGIDNALVDLMGRINALHGQKRMKSCSYILPIPGIFLTIFLISGTFFYATATMTQLYQKWIYWLAWALLLFYIIISHAWMYWQNTNTRALRRQYIHDFNNEYKGFHVEWIDDYNFLRRRHSLWSANIAVVAGFDVVIDIERRAEFCKQNEIPLKEALEQAKSRDIAVPVERQFDVFVGDQQGHLPMPFTISNV